MTAIDELAWAADSAVVREALVKRALEDRFWDARRSAAFALGSSHQPATAKDLVAIYGDRDARVRAAAVASLAHHTDELSLKTLRHAFEADSSYGVVVAALRALAVADSTRRHAYCEQALAMTSRNEMIKGAALRIIADEGSDEALGTVVRFTRYGVDRNIRIECIGLLASKWKGREEVADHLIRLLGDPSFHVRRAAIGALGTIGNRKALEPLRASMERESDTRVAMDAREAIKKIEKAQK